MFNNGIFQNKLYLYKKLTTTVITTFVILFPQFVLKSHLSYANVIGILFAVIISIVLEPELISRKNRSEN